MFLIKKTVKHGSLALRHFLLPLYMCSCLVCKHICPPTHIKRREKSEMFSGSLKTTRSNKTPETSCNSVSHDLITTPYIIEAYIIRSRAFSSQVGFPELWPLQGWSKTRALESLGREQTRAASQAPFASWQLQTPVPLVNGLSLLLKWFPDSQEMAAVTSCKWTQKCSSILWIHIHT